MQKKKVEDIKQIWLGFLTGCLKRKHPELTQSKPKVRLTDVISCGPGLDRLTDSFTWYCHLTVSPRTVTAHDVCHITTTKKLALSKDYTLLRIFTHALEALVQRLMDLMTTFVKLFTNRHDICGGGGGAPIAEVNMRTLALHFPLPPPDLPFILLQHKE